LRNFDLEAQGEGEGERWRGVLEEGEGEGEGRAGERKGEGNGGNLAEERTRLPSALVKSSRLSLSLPPSDEAPRSEANARSRAWIRILSFFDVRLGFPGFSDSGFRFPSKSLALSHGLAHAHTQAHTHHLLAFE
jgi:hypothetical protein